MFEDTVICNCNFLTCCLRPDLLIYLLNHNIEDDNYLMECKLQYKILSEIEIKADNILVYIWLSTQSLD